MLLVAQRYGFSTNLKAFIFDFFEVMNPSWKKKG